MRAPPIPRHRPRRQRGAALLTAMIIVTLVATLAGAMVWQQWRAVQVEAAERARGQAGWILSGALDFARLILREDQRSGRPTALTEPWATPLAEARLSTFLAADKSNADDGPDAFLSGSISDAQGRYNLANLVSRPKEGSPDTELATLARLCEIVGVETGVAQRIADGLRSATAAGGTAGAPLLPQTVAQLAWLGIEPAALQALQPYVVLIVVKGVPMPTKVNVNTAPREVLAAEVKGLDLATAERLIQIRQRTPFGSVDIFKAQILDLAPPVEPFTVKSDYFEVQGRLRLADRVLVQRALVQRRPDGQIDVLHSERVASVEPAGA